MQTASETNKTVTVIKRSKNHKCQHTAKAEKRLNCLHFRNVS